MVAVPVKALPLAGVADSVAELQPRLETVSVLLATFKLNEQVCAPNVRSNKAVPALAGVPLTR